MQIIVDLNDNPIMSQEYSTDTRITIGRGDDNVIVLSNSSVSRYHCVLEYVEGQWLIEDLGSMNGIQLDGNRVSRNVVTSKSIVAIRPFKLLISLPQNLADDDSSNEVVAEDSTVIGRGVVDFDQHDEEATLVGASVAHSRTSNNDYKNSDFVVIQNGVSSGTSVPLFKKNIIGRKNSCDLVLKDQDVEDEHVEIVAEGKGYIFSSLNSNASLKLNGKEVSSGSLKDGDILQLGQVELSLCLNNSSSASVGRSYLRVILLSILLFIVVGGTISFVLKDDTKQGEKALSLTGDHNIEDGTEDNHGSVDTDIKISKNSGEIEIVSQFPVKQKDLTLAEKRDFDLLIKEAHNYMEKEEYRTASTRIRSALGVAPGNTIAVQLLEECKRKSQEQAELVEENAKVSEGYRKSASAKLSKIEKLLKAGELQNALEAIAELEKLNLAYPHQPEILRKTKQVREKVTLEQVKYKNRVKSRKVSFEKQLGALRLTYDNAELAYSAGNYSQAKLLWLEVSKTELNIPEKKQAIINLDSLNKELETKIKKSYQKAKRAMGKKDYSAAIVSLDDVLKMDVDHPQAKKYFDELYVLQLKKAEHFYRKGLVFEGISRSDDAIKQWRKVIKVLPLSETKYHILAQKRLKEYGVR